MKDSQNFAASMPLPEWESHKRVWGDKIVKVVDNGPDCESAIPDDSHIIWHLACKAYVHVSNALKIRYGMNDPLGGYYVRYADGFESWSPAKAFEEGYARIK